MHLQQTKTGSRSTGGPQYYFHDVPSMIKAYLRKEGVCPVVLQTPYGIAKSGFMAVGKDHKLGPEGEAISGKVGHDRVQQASGERSIGEAIRHWYGLAQGKDFERIDVDAVIHAQGHFILIPTKIFLRGMKRPLSLERVHAPLSFHRDHHSKLWRKQIELRKADSPDDILWADSQLKRIVADHRDAAAKFVKEEDILRAAGALSILGMDLSAYVGKGYDCPKSEFKFLDLPVYPCPVEVKKRSADFSYQVLRYSELPRVVVICTRHDYVNPPEHVDVVELTELSKYLSSL